jgi:Immunoglobulin-like domain of bacterial spore germination/Sporulation and spore germination
LRHLLTATFSLLLATCNERPKDAATTPTAATAPTATASAEEVPDRQTPGASAEPVSHEIYIDEITGTNPLLVTGRARTFENAVSIRLRDARGVLISEEYVTSVGETGHHNPYEAQLWVTRLPGTSITLAAFEYSAKDGSIRSLTSKTIPYGGEHITADLMFPKGDCTRTAQFRRTLPKSTAMARLLTEALLAGPTEEEAAAGAQRAFPSGADVRTVTLRDGVLTVDLNERMQNVGGSCAAQAARQCLTETLRKLPTVQRVVITAGGSEALALQP